MSTRPVDPAAESADGRGGQAGRRPSGWHPKRRESSPARLVAFEVLREVDEDDAYANLVLPLEIRRAGLGKLDAAFATNLCYGTLRMRGRWDAIISRCARGRRIYDIDPPVLDLLRMGCQQLLGLQTPPHAAIHETVTVARNFFGQGAGGFVNAVLRRVGERADEWEEVIRSSTASRTEFLSLWHSHPRWIVEKFEEALAASGRDRDDVESVLAADNEPAKVALVARDITVGQLAERVGAARMEAEPGTLAPSALLLGGGDPHRLYAVRDGLAGVQDEGSQLVAAMLAGAPVEGPDGLWLDMCAGPGGKAATLASLAADRGARVHANEPPGARPLRQDPRRRAVHGPGGAQAQARGALAQGPGRRPAPGQAPGRTPRLRIRRPAARRRARLLDVHPGGRGDPLRRLLLRAGHRAGEASRRRLDRERRRRARGRRLRRMRPAVAGRRRDGRDVPRRPRQGMSGSGGKRGRSGPAAGGRDRSGGAPAPGVRLGGRAEGEVRRPGSPCLRQTGRIAP